MQNKLPRFSTKSLLAAAALALIALPAHSASTYTASGTAALPSGIDLSNYTLATTESLEINALLADGYTGPLTAFQLTGLISAPFANNEIRKTGDGVAVLTGLNTLSGTVFVDAGALGISALNPLSDAKITVAAGATVAALGINVPSLGDVTLAGTFVSFSGTNNVGTLILSGAATVDTTVNLGVTTLTLAQKTLNIEGAADLSVMTSNDAKDIIKDGAGTADLGALTLGDNATITVNEGQLTGDLDLNTKTLTITGAANFFSSSTSADAKITKSGAGTADLRTLTIDAATVEFQVDGAGNLIATSTALGANTITKTGTGAGVLALGNLSGTGTLDVDFGTASVGAGTNSAVTVGVDAGATLSLASDTGSAALTGNVTIAGTGVSGAALVSTSGTNTIGTLILSGAATVDTTVNLGVTTLTLAQKTLSITGAGNLNVTTSNDAKDITKDGTGTADLGTLTLGDTATFTVNAGGLKAGALDLNTKNLTITGANNFTATSTSADATITKSGAGTAALGALTIDAANVVFQVDGSGNLSATSTALGGNTITKDGTGAGVLALGNLSGTGALIINAGIAQVNDLTNSSAAVTIASGATLSLDAGATGTAKLTGGLSIAGTGAAGQGGAIVNVAGTNTVGAVTQTAASTIKVTGGSLTTGDLAGAFDLTLDVTSAVTPTAFTSGKTTTVQRIIKNGTGTASLGTVDTALDQVTVNAGVLEFLGSSSSVGFVPGGFVPPGDHGQLLKNGTGELQLKNATHFYGNGDISGQFQIDEGKVTVVNGATLSAQVSVNFGATFDVQAGATQSGNLISSGTSDIDGTMNGNMTLNNVARQTVSLGGVLNGNATVNGASQFQNLGTTTGDTIDLNDISFFNVSAGAVTQGDSQGVEITLRDSSVMQVDGQVFGNISARNTSFAIVFGTVTGGVDVTGDADFTIGSTGIVNGELTVTGDNQVDGNRTKATIDGRLNGNLTLANDAELDIGASGLLSGNLIVRNKSISEILGAVVGDVSLTSSAVVALGNPEGSGGSITGDIDLHQNSILFTVTGSSILGELTAQNATVVTLNGSLDGRIDLSDTSSLFIEGSGSAIGDLAMVDSSTTEIRGSLTGSSSLSQNAQLDLFNGGTLNGDLTLINSSDARLAGNATGAVSLSNTTTLTVQGTGDLTGDTTLNNSAILTVQLGGLLTGNLDGNNASVTTIAGTLTGAIDLADTAIASVSGTATGAASLAGTSGLTVSGDLVGAITAGNGSSAVITGTGEATGNATLNNAATLTVQLGGLLTGNLDANNTSVTTVTGTLTGNLDLADTALITVSGAANGSGVLAGDSTATISGILSGAALSASGTSDITVTSTGTIKGVGIGSNATTLTGSATLTVANLGVFTSSLTAGNSSVASISGVATGAATLTGDADLTVTATGSLTGAFAGSGTSSAAIVGTATGAATLNDTATLSVTGLLTGNLDGNNASVTTVAGTLTGNLDLADTAIITVAGAANGSGVLAGDSTATISGILSGAALSASGTSDITVTSTGTIKGVGLGSNATTLTGSATLTVANLGVFTSSLTAGNSSIASISGIATGAATLTGDADLTVTGTGSLTGALTASGTSSSAITGTATGAATLNDTATLTVTGTLTGNLDGNNGSTTTIAGTLTGAIDLADTAVITVSGAANGSGVLAGDSTATISGILSGAALSASGTSDITVTSTGTIKGVGIGSNATTLTGSATLTVANLGVFTSSLTAGNSSVASISGVATGAATLTGDAAFEVTGSGSLTGALTASGTSSSAITGTATGAATLNDTATLTVSGDLVGALTAGNGSSVVITGTGEATGNATLNNTATLTVTGTLTGNLDGNNGSTTTIAGTLTGAIDLADTAVITVSGAANGSGVLAGDSALTVSATGTLAGASLVVGGTSAITVSGAGKIQGVGIGSNALTLNNNATLTVDNSAGTILGSLTANDNSLTILKGTITGNVAINDTATLTGTGITGTIDGNLTQTGGVFAPGNSPGLTNVTGNYALSGGSLQVEIDGLAGAAVASGHDQVRVAGTITLTGTSVLNFDFANATAYQAQRGAVFQVLAGSTGEAKASIGRFDTVLWQDSDARVLFDHSTGRAYGTGLTYGQGGSSFQTFTQYANNANRLEIARALWMESIDYDNSDLGTVGPDPIVDENFASTANDVAAAQAKLGFKAYILTEGTVAEQTATDLGQAAISVLTAADVGEALDALSPEAYAGITDLGIRVARGFAFLPFNQRRMGAVNEWDFSVGYNNDEVESNGTSGYNGYKVRSNQVNVTAARDLSENARFTLGVGSDEGKVLARNFSADVDTLGLGLGLALTPDSDDYRLDLGIGFTSSDWDSTRQGVSAGNDMDTMAFAARLTINTKPQGDFSYKPFAALSYTDASIDSFVEGDVPGSVQLGVSGFERKSLLGELGMDFEYKLGAQTSLTGIVSWQHEFQDSGATDLRAEFVEDGVDDTSFSVRSAGFGQDFFRAGLGLRHELNPTSAVSLSVNAIFGSDIGSGHQVRADYSIRF